MVREALQVTEVAIKLSALGIKNALALSLAYAKENPKVKGKTSLDRLLREGKELKIIALQSKDVGQFKELAKQYGVLFAVIKDKAQNEKVDVMFKAEDVAKLNRIYEQLGYAIPKVTTADRKKDPTRRQSGDSLLTRGKNPLDIDPRPSVRATIMALKNAAQKAEQAQEKVQDKPLMESHYTAPCPTIKDLWMALNNQRDKRSKEIALALRIFATGSMQAFAQPTNVDMSNRLICFNIQSLGEQLKPVAMLSMLEYINTAVMSNERNDPKAATWVYFDEIYLLLRDSLSANFLYTSWKRFRKYNAYATGITQNVQDCLTNDTAYAMLANSEFVVMLRQTKDIDSVVELYGLSEPQRKYLLLAQPGEGIIKMGNSLIPFNNPQPKDTKTYKLLTTKPGEME